MARYLKSKELLDLLRKKYRGQKHKPGDPPPWHHELWEHLASGAIASTGLDESGKRVAIDRTFYFRIPALLAQAAQRRGTHGRIDLVQGQVSRPHSPYALFSDVYDDVEFDADHVGRALKVEVPKKAGRPTEHDWDGATAYANDWVERNGLPETKQRLIEVVEDWFEENDGGRSPDRKHIRLRVTGPLYGAK